MNPEELPRAAPHPSPALLSAYLAEELTDIEADQVREHLVACDQCREQVQGLTSFEDDLLSGPPLEPGATDAPWADFEKRLEERLPPAPKPEIPPSPWETRRPLAFPAFAQAALVVLCLGLGGLSWKQHQDLEAASGPRLNTAQAILSENPSPRRGGSSNTAQLPTGRSGLSITLTSTQTEEFSDYRVELIDETERTLWALEGLEKQRGGVFRLHLPSESLEPGHYRLDVHGLADGREERIASYPMILESSP